MKVKTALAGLLAAGVGVLAVGRFGNISGRQTGNPENRVASITCWWDPYKTVADVEYNLGQGVRYAHVLQASKVSLGRKWHVSTAVARPGDVIRWKITWAKDAPSYWECETVGGTNRRTDTSATNSLEQAILVVR